MVSYWLYWLLPGSRKPQPRNLHKLWCLFFVKGRAVRVDYHTQIIPVFFFMTNRLVILRKL